MHGKGQPLELLRREAGMRWHAARALGGLEHVDDPHLTARRTLPGGDERTWERAVHCHSSVNVWGGAFRGEWQCRPHCHSASSVLYRYDQGRVAVRPVRSGSSGSATHTATRW